MGDKKVYKFSGKFVPQKIYIERSQLNNKLVQSILEKFPGINPVIINNLNEVKKTKKEYIDILGKNDLYLVEEKFDIFKSCPCTKNVFSCNYYILPKDQPISREYLASHLS